MTDEASSRERLREYLRSLSPEAQAMLIAELERSLLREEESPGSRLVLEELRHTVRAAAQPMPRIGDAARRFFAPLEPYLIDAPSDHTRVGRLTRAALEPIWRWLGRDLIAAEANALGEDINRALLAGEHTKAEHLLGVLHERAAKRMKKAVAAIKPNDKARRRFAVEVGTPRAIKEVTALTRVLAERNTLADLAARLPARVRDFGANEVDRVKALLDAAVGLKSLQSGPDAPPDLLLPALLLVMNRLPAPWQLIRLANRAAGSNRAVLAAATPYGLAVDIVLGDLDSTIDEMRSSLRAGRSVGPLLHALRETAGGIRREMDFSGDSPWARRLAANGLAAGNLLRAEMEAAPVWVMRLIRPRPGSEHPAVERPIAEGAIMECAVVELPVVEIPAVEMPALDAAAPVLDAAAVRQTEARLELVAMCRQFADEPGLREAAGRIGADLARFLEAEIACLRAALRRDAAPERIFRQSQIDAARRFGRILCGPEAAGRPVEAGGAAGQGDGADRRAGRA